MTDKIIEKKALINGEWTESESGERFEVRYPGDGRLVGTAPKCTRKDVKDAVAAAIEGQKVLARLSLLKRIEMLRKAVEIAGKSDAEASRIYAEAYETDAEFYAFLRGLEAYRKTIGEGTTMVLPPDHEFFRLLSAGSEGGPPGSSGSPGSSE